VAGKQHRPILSRFLELPTPFQTEPHHDKDNAYDKIRRALEKNGAGFGDIVKIVSYITDMRFQADYGRCRSEIFGATPPPAHTLLNIVQLAWPRMMVEVDVTAMVPLK